MSRSPIHMLLVYDPIKLHMLWYFAVEELERRFLVPRCLMKPSLYSFFGGSGYFSILFQWFHFLTNIRLYRWIFLVDN